LAAVSQFDQLAITGNAQLHGILNLTRLDGYLPSLGDTFRILTAKGVKGALPRQNGTQFLGTQRRVDVLITTQAVDLITELDPTGLPRLNWTTLFPPTLSWPGEFTGWRLQTTTNLNLSIEWEDVIPTGSNYLSFGLAEPERYWKLIQR